MPDVTDFDPNDLTIRVMDRAALDQAIEWAAVEGWNPGLHDADCFHTADPTGILIGYLGDEPIASISVVRYSSAFGFLGFYIVRPDKRGRPLFADGEREADLLFEALAARARGASVFLDLPESNQAAVQLAVRYGLSPVFETARMYRGVRPELPLAQTYGISTFELG